MVMKNNRPLSTFEKLPGDIQLEIFSRVAKNSRADIRNLLAAIPTLGSTAAVPTVFKNLNIHPLTVHPLASVERYKEVMPPCLANGNRQAHYVRGIVEYFENNNIEQRLVHLRTAAEGGYENASYLYGIIQLCSEEEEIGQAMLDSLGWRENKSRINRCWRRIKRSLHGIRVIPLPVYTDTYWNMRPTIGCHPDGLFERCDDCFFYKQITKFVYFY